MQAPRLSIPLQRALHGEWLVEWGADPAADAFRALNLVDLRRVDAEGAVADELRRRSDPHRRADQEAPPSPSAALSFAARVQPPLGEFVSAQSVYPPTPATRAAVLRGTGYGQLFVELTDQCNERCVHCYASASPEGSIHLPWDYLEAAVRDAVEMDFGIIQLTGGDPLVSSHVLPAARLVRELGGRPVEVYTNGLKLHGTLFEGLRETGAHFAFSLYGHDPIVHDAVTQTPRSHERTLRAIRLAAESGSPLRVSVIVTDNVSPDTEPTYALLEAHGVARDKVTFGGSVSVGRGDFLPLSRLTQTSPHAAAPTEAPAPTPTHRSDSVHHGRFAGRVAIAPDGTVMPCVFDRAVSLGHLRDASLRDILTDDRPLTVGVGVESARRARRHAHRLSCLECQVRAELLA